MGKPLPLLSAEYDRGGSQIIFLCRQFGEIAKIERGYALLQLFSGVLSALSQNLGQCIFQAVVDSRSLLYYSVPKLLSQAPKALSAGMERKELTFLI